MRASTCALAILAVVAFPACGDDAETGGTGGGGAGDGATSSSTSSVGGAGATATTTGPSSSSSAGGSGGSGGGPDVTPPTTTFAAAPPDGQSNGLPSAFELSCSEPGCTFACSIGGGAFAPCDAAFAFDPLAPGDFTLAVRATDAAGNVEDPPAVHDWSLVFGWRSVAAAVNTTCAVSGEHQLHCWGADDYGGLGDGPGGPALSTRPVLVDAATDWEGVSSGTDALCAHKAGVGMYCWGDTYALGSPGYTDAPTPYDSRLVRLEATYDFSCGLDAAGALYCAGYGTDGALGDGNLLGHYVDAPTAVGSDVYLDVAVGERHACAVRDDGRLLCWGYPSVADDPVAVPTPVDGALDWSRVAAGADHTCAVKTTGAVYCWGSNYSGQLGRPGPDPVATPTQVGAAEDWVDVFASEATTCAVKADGATSCWGANYRGEVGSDTVALGAVATPTSLASSFRSVSGRGDHLCGLTTDGFVRCWGENYAGLLGRGVDDFAPAMLPLDDGFDLLSVTNGGGCGIRAGELACWGSARSNGLESGFFAPSPAALSVEMDWTAVSVSMVADGHACGIRDEVLYCWGTNAYGQLGDGTTTPSAAPILVSVNGVTGWRAVSAGIHATCAITTDDDLLCWGSNQYGQLGVGSPNLAEPVPQQVQGSGWDTIDMARYRVAARRTDGTFWHWGVNDATVPEQLPGADWVEVGTTGYAECGIKTDGTLHCTQQGIPGVYPAGNGTNWAHVIERSPSYCALDQAGAVGCFVPASQTSFNSSPAIEGGGGWLRLHAQDSLVCGLRSGGARSCRGLRRFGSLGDGFDERVPELVLAP